LRRGEGVTEVEVGTVGEWEIRREGAVREKREERRERGRFRDVKREREREREVLERGGGQLERETGRDRGIE
jgi:hypothetical protein